MAKLEAFNSGEPGFQQRLVQELYLEGPCSKGDKPDCGARCRAGPRESCCLKMKRNMKGLSDSVDAEVV